MAVGLGLALAANSPAEIRQFDKSTTEKLGVAIYEQDIRAAIATDLLLAKKIDAKKEGLRGWIVEGDAYTMLVRFVREKDGPPEAFYDVMFDGTRPPTLQVPSDRRLTPAQLALFKARNLASKGIKRPASRTYNIVMLPDPATDGLLVYALAASVVPNEVVVGGHYRFSISKDGERVLRGDELFVSFLKLSTKPGDLPAGAHPEALFMNTLLSDLPLETHVYLSLLHKVPLYVSTRDHRIWKVEGGTITTANPG